VLIDVVYNMHISLSLILSFIICIDHVLDIQSYFITYPIKWSPRSSIKLFSSLRPSSPKIGNRGKLSDSYFVSKSGQNSDKSVTVDRSTINYDADELEHISKYGYAVPMSIHQALCSLEAGNLTAIRANMYVEGILIQGSKTKLPSRLWFKLLQACMTYELVPASIRVFKYAAEASPKLSHFQINKYISFLCSSGNFNESYKVFSESLGKGFVPTAHSFSPLLKYSQSKSQLFKLLMKMEALNIQPNVICYTAAIKSCETNYDLKSALLILDMMRINGIVPNEITYSCLISVAARACAGKVALSLLREMQRNGYHCNALVYGGVVYACARSGLWSEVTLLLNHMIKLRIEISENVMVGLVSACRVTSRDGTIVSSDASDIQWEKALWLVDNYMTKTSHVSNNLFTMCMSVCEMAQKHDVVLNLFDKMVNFGLSPCKSSLAYKLRALCSLGRISEAVDLLEKCKQTIFPSMSMFRSVFRAGHVTENYNVSSKIFADVAEISKSKVQKFNFTQFIYEDRDILYSWLSQFQSFASLQLTSKANALLDQIDSMVGTMVEFYVNGEDDFSYESTGIIPISNLIKDMNLESISIFTCSVMRCHHKLGLYLTNQTISGAIPLDYTLEFVSVFNSYIRNPLFFLSVRKDYLKDTDMMSFVFMMLDNLDTIVTKDLKNQGTHSTFAQIRKRMQKELSMPGKMYNNVDELKDAVICHYVRTMLKYIEKVDEDDENKMPSSFFTKSFILLDKHKADDGILKDFEFAETYYNKFPNEIKYTALNIFAKYSGVLAISKVPALFEELYKDKYQMSLSTYNSTLKICAKLSIAETAATVLQAMEENHLMDHLTSSMVGSALIAAAGGRRYDLVKSHLKLLQDRNMTIHSWIYSVCIAAFAINNDWDDAISLLRDFQSKRYVKAYTGEFVFPINDLDLHDPTLICYDDLMIESSEEISQWLLYSSAIEIFGNSGYREIVDELYLETLQNGYVRIIDPATSSISNINMENHAIFMSKAGIRYLMGILSKAIRGEKIVYSKINETHYHHLDGSRITKEISNLKTMNIYAGKHQVENKRAIQQELRELTPPIKAFVRTGVVVTVPGEDLRNWMQHVKSSVM
jgi:pentatricopeptide repeat protein